MSQLRSAAENYLAMRRALGFKLERAAHLLPEFVDYLESTGAETITTELALAWATQPPKEPSQWWVERLDVVRGFARHLSAFDPATEVPPADLLARRPCRAEPYLYSDSDVAALMSAARGLSLPLKATTYETLIGLLAVTGMRIGEAIRLDRTDLDAAEGALTIRGAKFGKTRYVPLHPSALEAMQAYADKRDRLCPHPRSPSFFLSTVGTRLIYNNVHLEFRKLAGKAGLAARSPSCRPRPHDLRH